MVEMKGEKSEREREEVIGLEKWGRKGGWILERMREGVGYEGGRGRPSVHLMGHPRLVGLDLGIGLNGKTPSWLSPSYVRDLQRFV